MYKTYELLSFALSLDCPNGGEPCEIIALKIYIDICAFDEWKSKVCFFTRSHTLQNAESWWHIKTQGFSSLM